MRQHRTIPALRLKHRSGSCGTASALPKCSIMSGCSTRIVLRGQKPLALCDRCPCFGSLHPPLAALTFAASSIICVFGLASAAPRSPYRHLELCGIALEKQSMRRTPDLQKEEPSISSPPIDLIASALADFRGQSIIQKKGFRQQMRKPFLRRRIVNISFSFWRGFYRWPPRPSCGRG